MTRDEQVNPDFICPITLELMRDPVIMSDGNSYERSAAEEWLKTHDISPMTSAKLASKALIPNLALKRAIANHLEEQSVCHPPPQSSTRNPNQEATTTAQSENALEISVSLTPIANENMTHIALSLRETAPSKPLRLICVLDKSGSMDLPSQQQSSTTGAFEPGTLFSRMDLLKHSMRTIIELLRPEDQLAIISFSRDASLNLPMVAMRADGKKLALRVIESLQPSGGTNLWRGLEMGLDLATNIPSEMHTAIILQTDGEPTKELLPIRGIVKAMEAKLLSTQASGNRFSVHSCGYGYGDELDSRLLRRIAELGRGSYAYIPDGSMVGTTFTHLFCNLVSVVLTNVQVFFPDLPGGVEVGPMRAGQVRNLIVPTKCEVLRIASNEGVCAFRITNVSGAVDKSASFVFARWRFVQLLAEGIALAEQDETARAASLLDAFCLNVLSRVNDPRVAALLSDIQASKDADRGQVNKSFVFWNKWGKHYLPSILSAHARQEKVNFKDASLEMYSTPALEHLLSKAEEVFSNLPPPQSAVAAMTRLRDTPIYLQQQPRFGRGGGGVNAQPMFSMASMMSRDSGCFTGDTLVAMRHAGKEYYVRTDALKKGSTLASGAKVVCLVKYKNANALVHRVNGLGITSYHPVRDGNVNQATAASWTFPKDRFAQDGTTDLAEDVFNLVLDRAPHMIQVPGEMQCVTLGHGLWDNNVVAHPYFGSQRCVEDLKRKNLAGFNAGFVELCAQTHRFQRDASTGMVKGL